MGGGPSVSGYGNLELLFGLAIGALYCDCGDIGSFIGVFGGRGGGSVGVYPPGEL